MILSLRGIMLMHWRRFRAEADRYRAWQSVFGQRGGKVALTVGFVAPAVRPHRCPRCFPDATDVMTMDVLQRWPQPTTVAARKVPFPGA